jgi:hypothetical protein
MRGLSQRKGGIWWGRVEIPADVRESYGKREEVRSLRTKDKVEAERLWGKIEPEIRAKVATLRAKPVAPEAEPELLTPDVVYRRIRDWRDRKISEAQIAIFNGKLSAPTGDAKAARSEMVYALSQPGAWRGLYAPDRGVAWTRYSMDDQHAEAAGVESGHAILTHTKPHFALAWTEAERQIERFFLGDFDWSLKNPKVSASPAQTPVTAPVQSGIKLSALVNRFIAARKPGEERDIHRMIWQRLHDHQTIPEDSRAPWRGSLSGTTVVAKPKALMAPSKLLRFPFPRSIWMIVGLLTPIRAANDCWEYRRRPSTRSAVVPI